MLGRGSNPTMGTLLAIVANKENNDYETIAKGNTTPACKGSKAAPASSDEDGKEEAETSEDKVDEEEPEETNPDQINDNGARVVEGGDRTDHDATDTDGDARLEVPGAGIADEDGDNSGTAVQSSSQTRHPPLDLSNTVTGDDDDEEENDGDKDEDDDGDDREAAVHDEAKEDEEEDVKAASSTTGTMDTGMGGAPTSNVILTSNTEPTGSLEANMSEGASGVTSLAPQALSRKGPTPVTVQVKNAFAVQVGNGNVLTYGAQKSENGTPASSADACQSGSESANVAVYINNCDVVQVGDHNRINIRKVTPQENAFVRVCCELDIDPEKADDIHKRLSHDDVRRQFAKRMAESFNVTCKIRAATRGCILLELEVPTEADRLQLLRMARDGTFQQVLLETFLPEFAGEGRAVSMNLAIGVRNPSQDMVEQLQGAVASSSTEKVEVITIPAVIANGTSTPDPRPDEAESSKQPENDMESVDGSLDQGHRDVPVEEGPGVDSPGVDSPGVDSPGVDSPGVDSPGVHSPGVDSPGYDSPGVNSPGVDRNMPASNTDNISQMTSLLRILSEPGDGTRDDDRLEPEKGTTLGACPGSAAHSEEPSEVTTSFEVFERSRSKNTGDDETTRILSRLAITLDRREWRQVAGALRVQQPDTDLSAEDTQLRMRILREWQEGPLYREQFDKLLLALEACGRDDFAVELLQSAPHVHILGFPVSALEETHSEMPTQVKETAPVPKQSRKPKRSPEVDPRTPLRRMPYSLMKKVAMELDPPGLMVNWRDLAAHAGYSMQEIGVFEMGYLKLGGSPTTDLLQAWGSRNATVQDLETALRRIGLLNVADMLSPDSLRLGPGVTQVFYFTSSKMANVSLLAVLVLCVSVSVRAQDVITDQAGYEDKGYCTYTYVVPPGSRTGTFSPPRLEEQLAETKQELAETKEEMGRLKNQVDLLTSLVQTLLSQQSDFTSKMDSLSAELLLEKIRSAQLEQNLTQELQEQKTSLQAQVQNLTTTLSEYDVIIKQRLQCTCERLVAGDVSSSTSARLSSEPGSTAAAPLTKMTSPTEPLSITQSGVAGDVSSSTSARLSSGPGSTAAVPLTKMTSPTESQSTTQSAETTAAPEITTSPQASIPPPGTELPGSETGNQIRLVGGSTPLEGRVEVRNGTGQWGSVCDDRWDLQDAHVVCRQLGFGTALEEKLAGHFGEGSGNVWLDEVACRGDETSLGDCPADSWGRSDCSHKEDAGVVCEEKSAVRLADGHVPWEGRVEFRPGEKSEWGAVCNTSWTEDDVRVVCKQLGYTGGAVDPEGSGEGTGRIWLGDVTCSGEETNILSCGFTWEPSDCDHGQDVAVICTGDVSIRLNGSQDPSEGRVEVRLKNGDWGTICDDGFDDRDAQVVCRQLGYRGGVAMEGGVFPEGTGNIWLDNLNCGGNESSVADCQVNRWGEHDCTHKEDAGVVCVPEEDCAGYMSSGFKSSGVYRIGLLPSDVEAYCDMDTARGGWTVIQRRQDGSVPFNRTWEEYKQGFGDVNGEYWLGNENIHILTNNKNHKLRVDLLDWNGTSRFAEYSSFRMSGEWDQYKLSISGFSGTAGSAMSYNNGKRFSTVDRDNDINSVLHCSQLYGESGWWFGQCSHSILNGRYLGNCGNSCPHAKGVVWYHWRGYTYSLKSVSMKIRQY
ncbi:PRSS12 [Branchiostoma lanceolatum]|uniref:Soluble scavenger receptor cysteine-rich domain-containing protein SSC5D n=1 Tax=Branchiostoma lanceolatum TaxID=7740 RepID=A0A8K0EFK8_BRALA|nr:PRSS12 [Branchiostoma lanceolatum]